MTTEFTESTPDPAAPPPPSIVAAAVVDSGKKPVRKQGRDEDERPGQAKDPDDENASFLKALPKELRALQHDASASIKDIITAFGNEGQYKISLHRLEPDTCKDPITGNIIKTAGHLKTYQKAIDEDYLATTYGGGKYNLRFLLRNPASGKFQYYAHRTLEVAGEPKLDAGALARTTDIPGPAKPANGETPGMVGKMFDVMQKQLEDARHEKPSGVDPMMMSLVNNALAARDNDIKALRDELKEARTSKPEKTDTYKDQLLEKLIDGDSVRLQAVKTQYESEIRTLKENHTAEERRTRQREEDLEKRLRDQFDRERKEQKDAHEREIAMLRMSNEMTMRATTSSNEVALASAKTAFDTQLKVLEAENRRLERDNNELRIEVKELRGIKDKPLLTQMKEIKELKDAMGMDDEEDDKGTVAQIVEAVTNPATLETVQGFFKKAAPQQQQNPAPQVTAGAGDPGKRHLVRHNGQKYWLEPDGKTLTGPIMKKKPTVSAPSAPGEPPMPEIDQASITMVMSMLEKAFAGNQDPETVAQSYRAHVPDEILQTIRALAEQHASMDRGIDAFMTKVAKLQGSSPLNSQGGRNWVRKVGKALVGE